MERSSKADNVCNASGGTRGTPRVCKSCVAGRSHGFALGAARKVDIGSVRSTRSTHSNSRAVVPYEMHFGIPTSDAIFKKIGASSPVRKTHDFCLDFVHAAPSSGKI